MRIEMCSESMFRVTKVPAQQMPDNEKWMVVNYNFPQVDFSVDGKQIKTSKLQEAFRKLPGAYRWLMLRVRCSTRS